MANTIKLRRSATTGAVPTTSQLALGEVAINTFDGKLFIKKDDGTQSIVEIGASGGGGGSVTVGSTAPSSPSSGDLWYDTANAIFYLYVDDGNSQQWIETGRAGSGGGSFNNAVTNTYTGAQIGSIVTLTDAATIAMDASLSNNFQVTLAGNRTFGNPTNMTPGQVGSIFINQDGTGSRTLSWSSYWLFPSGTAPTLSTAGNSSDRVDYIIQSSTQIHAQFAGDFQ